MSENDEYKVTYTITGDKGTGKTTFAFMFSGKKLCFSYDNKSQRIKKYLFNDSDDIIVVNAVKKYNRTPEDITKTAKLAYDDVIEQLENYSGKVDWVIHDCLQKLHEICEMMMRDAYKIGPFEGVKNQNVWKYRRVLISNIHQKSIQCANKGVIYTTFAGTLDVEIVDGEVIERREVPRYFDIVEEETDVLFKTFIHNDKKKNTTQFMCKVWTSKIPKWETGKTIDLTDRYKKIERR